MFSSQPSQQALPTTTNNNNNKNGVVMAWDPKNPAALLVPVVLGGGQEAMMMMSDDDDDDDDGKTKVTALQINTVLSHTGVGCNEHEIAALMQLLEAHEEQSRLKPAVRTSWNTIKTLSKAYRNALRECLCRWEDNLIELEETTTDDTVDENLSLENLELLKLVYAITHLSEIFLLPPPAEEIAIDYYEDLFAVPGALTADTVRYLRHHHTTNALQQVDPDVLQEIMNSLHPDQVDGGEPYWNLVYTLVKQGNLEQAWAALSRHSACRRAVEATTTTTSSSASSTLDDYEAKTLEQDRDGFYDLRNILLSAPIPGGRDDADDVGLDGPASLQQSSSSGTDSQRQPVYLEGVETTAYQMWETSQTTTEGTDFPSHYNPRAASMKRNNWQQYVLELESVRRLKRKIPQLDGILAILSGNLRGVQFQSWAEALISELIYSNPSILPGNIQVRAEKLMEKYPRSQWKEMDEVLLSIMQGNAGKVIEVLHTFGGGSGAALPSTTTSLLCNLYVDFQIPIVESFQMDLLKAAAFGITSSLAASSHSDTAAQLVVRLLIPYAKPRGDPSIVATLGATLERHTPASDAEARNLIDLCRLLVEQKKSVLVLEGCVSLVLVRYRKYLKEERPGGALHWLLVGMELEASLYALGKDGGAYNWQKVTAMSVCYRHLVMWCNRISGALLVGILEEKEGLGLVYATAKAMVDSVKEGPMEGYATKVPEVMTLELLLAVYDGIAGKDWTAAARSITLCLQEEANELDDGVVASVAPRCMHWELMQLGHRVVEADEARESVVRAGEYTPAFDVKGVQVLMEQLTTIPLSRELEGMEPLPAKVIQKMHQSLAKALTRAFVAENARRKPDTSNEPDQLMISKIRSVDIHKYDLKTQEAVVQHMLDF